MKKIINLSPFIVVAIIIAILVSVFFVRNSNKPPKVEVTSSTLKEMVISSKLSTAKFVQHGIAKTVKPGEPECQILYYALVRANVDFSEIDYVVDEEDKTVKIVLPENFNFDVELLNDKGFQYYPNSDNRNLKDIEVFCKEDARNKAEKNKQLQTSAKESLNNTIVALLEPFLNQNDYTIITD